jgi:signal transduction histidine kinase
MAVSKAKILVVDDEPGIRYFLEETLGDAGYHVVSAESGKTALDLVSREDFDIALLDLKMNGIGGLEVLAVLRQQAPDTVAIVLTAHGSTKTAIEALRQGAYDYLLKPCDPQQLRESVRTGLEKRRQELQERADFRFISHVSHQLRNPLTNTGLHLDTLDPHEPERHASRMDIIKQEALQLEGIVNSMLTLSQLEGSTAEMKFAPEDLNALAEQVISACQVHAEAAGLEVIFEPEADLPWVRAEHSQLIQLITNLITNAINHTRAGQVRVSTYLDAERSRACLQVQDTGIGIEPDDLPHLFERFYRGSRSIESAIPGTGLGLTIVKQIVDLHKGKIEIESQVDQGTTFKVWLPVDGQ